MPEHVAFANQPTSILDLVAGHPEQAQQAQKRAENRTYVAANRDKRSYLTTDYGVSLLMMKKARQNRNYGTSALWDGFEGGEA